MTSLDQTSNSLTALFQSQGDAQDAVDALVAEGIPESSIRLLPGYENDGDLQPATPDVRQGFWQSLTDFFMPEQDRHSYAEGLSRGGYMVAVSNISGAHYDRVLEILDREGALDLEQEEEQWRGTGWTGYEADDDYALDTTAVGSSQTARLTDDEAIPVVEEQLRVGKRDVSHGRVRVRSYVVETPIEEQVDLRQENVRIERRPVDRALTSADTAFQDRVIEVEERAEEAVVEKTARVVEEISLSKDTTSRHETISDSVKHTEVEVEDDRDTISRTGTGDSSKI